MPHTCTLNVISGSMSMLKLNKQQKAINYEWQKKFSIPFCMSIDCMCVCRLFQGTLLHNCRILRLTSATSNYYANQPQLWMNYDLQFTFAIATSSAHTPIAFPWISAERVEIFIFLSSIQLEFNVENFALNINIDSGVFVHQKRLWWSKYIITRVRITTPA